jgi:hypothetical protein
VVSFNSPPHLGHLGTILNLTLRLTVSMCVVDEYLTISSTLFGLVGLKFNLAKFIYTLTKTFAE